ncbi:MAG TPA: ABC transporter permease [Terracidiphilus sp.]|jgi:ABC-2 type transport system permease protein|nr:ABC transporter permease [Terracidiphilus sp.]HEX4283983.1 ABC transporter permease [Terracidiphilus sp.]
MRNILLIARREYLEQVRGRAFRMTTIGLPAVFAGILGVGYLSSLGLGANRHMTVVAANVALANQIRDQLVGDKDAKAHVDVITQPTQQLHDTLVRQVQTAQLDGLIWVDTEPGKIPTGSFISESSGDFITAARVKSALTHAVLDERLTSGGMKQNDADNLVDGVTLDTLQVKKDGSLVKTNAQASLWKGYVMALLLSMTTMIYGMNVARSIIQEKTSRIFEVMLAIARPGDLLAGKLIGVGAVGLTQIGIWLVAGAVLLFSPLAAALMSGEFAVHFTWTEAILFPVYFVLGYLLYSSLFAGLAATCETEQELQMYMPLAAAPTWLSFALIMLIINDSNSGWSVAASLFPPTAPVIMFLRMASEIPPAWQLALSIVLLMLSVWGVLWFSTRLYRVGILMYGKRATLPELLRWLRYS